QPVVPETDNVHNSELTTPTDQHHPVNLIPELCRQFYQLEWATGTGGSISIRSGDNVFVAPSGAQKKRDLAQRPIPYLHSRPGTYCAHLFHW
ncbi:Methylthioribulose-1-phosphate dehydratase, partial [Coemansia aciculifera]